MDDGLARPARLQGGKGRGLGNILGGGGSAPAPANDRAARGGGLGDVLGGMLGGCAGRRGPGGPGGGLGDLLGAGRGGGGLGGLLGGLLAGGAAGGILNGGLRNLVQDMQDNGQGDIAQSWISRGANREISPNELAQAAGADAIDQLAGETGLPRDELLSGLSQQLPELVDRLTPDGRLPTDDEASTWV